MANQESMKQFTVTESVSPEDILKVAAETLLKSQHVCEKNNPKFVADHVKTKLQEFNFIVCGAPRTGKSTLINAIINKNIAPTRSGSSAVTLETKCYSLEGTCPEQIDEKKSEKSQEAQEFRINIWDTKGITTWDKSIADIIHEKNPMCMILCSSPGSFANDEFIRPLINQCLILKIFVALVCTNQWNDSDEKRTKVIEEFTDLLKVYKTETHEENGIVYYGNIGLIAMVNSIPYSNRRTGIYKPKSGVNSLIYGIMKSLNEDHLLGWCYTLMENDGFWSQMQIQIEEFFAQKFTY
ncbi:unnamed protein product, partial [Rotaria sp. Silwood2]